MPRAKPPATTTQTQLIPGTNIPALSATSKTNLVEIYIPTPAPITDGTAMLDRVRAMTVTDADSYTAVARVRKNALERWEETETQRVAMKEPALESGRRVDAFFKPVLQSFRSAADIATTKLEAYDQQQRVEAVKKQREADALAKKQREEAAAAAEKERQDAEMALQEIQGIQQQVIIASMGRIGVREGGTLECIRDTLAETQAWEIDERFGRFRELAVQTKAAAILAIQALETAFVDRAAAKTANRSAAEERKAAVAARMAQMEAEDAAAEQETENKRLVSESKARVQDLQKQAASIVAPSVQVEEVPVEGLSRPKTWKWKLLDKSKLLDQFLLVDEKAISRIVTTMKERAPSVIGEGAIEIYQDAGIRQA